MLCPVPPITNRQSLVVKTPAETFSKFNYIVCSHMPGRCAGANRPSCGRGLNHRHHPKWRGQRRSFLDNVRLHYYHFVRCKFTPVVNNASRAYRFPQPCASVLIHVLLACRHGRVQSRISLVTSTTPSQRTCKSDTNDGADKTVDK